LEYVDYLSNPEKIIEQYGEDVKIGDISKNLHIAFSKLELYMNLIQAAVKVSSMH
jgi:hypothetical protein